MNKMIGKREGLGNQVGEAVVSEGDDLEAGRARKKSDW